MKRLSSRSSDLPPDRSCRQESRAGWPTRASSNVLAKAVMGAASSSKVVAPMRTPCAPSSSPPHDAAQARIGGERSKETLPLDELLGGASQLVQGQEQEAVFVEERAAVRPPHAPQDTRMSGERLGELVRRLVGDLGRVAL